MVSPPDPKAPPVAATDSPPLAPPDVANSPETSPTPPDWTSPLPATSLFLRIEPEDRHRLLRHPRLRALTGGRGRATTVERRFFDTAEGHLASAGVTLRLQRSGRSTVQTLSSIGRWLPAGEWENPVSDLRPELERLPDPQIQSRFAERIGSLPLLPVLEARVRRTSRLLQEGDHQLRLSLEVAALRGADQSERSVCELGLESLAGAPAFPYELAQQLCDRVRLKPVPAAPGTHSLDELLGHAPKPSRAPRLVLERGVTLDAALARIFRSGLQHALLNEEPARAGEDPEGVHQLRVALRRLRSALSCFRDVIPATDAKRLGAELKWLASELGDARDLDVFLGETLAPVLAAFPGDAALARLHQAAELERADAYDRVQAALASPRVAQLWLDLGSWIERRGWREQPVSPRSARLFAPAREVGGSILAKRHKKVRRLGRNLAERGVEERHQLRLQCKKLRYAVEFLESLYARKRTRRYRRRMASLQEVLGHLNDQSTADRVLGRLVDRLGLEATPAVQRGAGVVAGWTAHLAQERLDHLADEWERFHRSDVFWSDALA
ncbi:MAG: CHAD domain-containing protein [Proteobacteria bacterium]|nr:CHAD domain-containing protein [Pseudomonadota bacterium]